MSVRLGKHPARIDKRAIRLETVVASLPTPLDTIDWYRGQTSWGMMANDSLGDCTCAALGHAEQTLTANCPEMSELTPTDRQVIDLYSAACGYQPGDSATDQGGDEIAVLNYVRRNGMFGDTLIAFADPSPGDIVHVKQAISYFGGVYIGLQLPDAVCQGDMVANSWNLTGDINPSPYNGHAVWVAGYNPTGPVCITWGVVKQMSWKFWEVCCDETHALLTKNWLAQYGMLDVAAQAMQNALLEVAH